MSEEGMPKQLQMGQDAIPDLLRVGSIPSNTEANVDTDILEPVIFSESFIRYQLVNKGFLNPYSRLTFQLENVSSQSASNLRSFLPIHVGVDSIIKSAQLKIGNQTIQEIEDFTDYYGYKSLFVNNEVQKEREQYLSGRCISHEKTLQISAGTAPVSGTDASFSRNQTVGLQLDNGTEYANTNLLVRDECQIVNGPVFSVTLEELFPLFRGAQFPLYVLNSDMPVQIELTMAPEAGARVCVKDGTDLNVKFSLNRNDSRMIADYTSYDGEVMAAWAKKNSQLMFTYMDYRL